MPSVNPGPATTVTPSQLAVMTPQNILGPTVPGQGGNALRLLGVVRGLSLNGTGDAAVIQIINCSSYTPASVMTTNANADVHLAALGIFTAAAAGGTAILANAVLTGQVSATFSYLRAVTTAATLFTAQTLYVNIGTASAGNTTDLFLYGYDCS